MNFGGAVARLLRSVAERLTAGPSGEAERKVSEEELLAVAERALESRSIEVEEHELIESVIAFGDTLIREVMVPRPDIISVGAAFTADCQQCAGDAAQVADIDGVIPIPGRQFDLLD